PAALAGHALDHAADAMAALERAARACVANHEGTDSFGVVGWLGTYAAAIVVVIRGDRAGLACAGDVRAWRVRDGAATSLVDDARAPSHEEPMPRVLLIQDQRIALDLLGAGARPPHHAPLELRSGDRVAIDAARVAGPDDARLMI